MVKDIHIDLTVSGDVIREDLIEEWVKDCLHEHGVECIDIKANENNTYINNIKQKGDDIMFIGTLYNKTIKTYEMSDLERVASRIANKLNNRVDEMIVDYEDIDGTIFEPARLKLVRVDRGKWKIGK